MNDEHKQRFWQAVNHLKTDFLDEDQFNDGRSYARAHNFLFDERIGESRWQEYLQALNLQESSSAKLRIQHAQYVEDRLQSLTIPPTFLSSNASGCIGSLAGNQYLVRVEVIHDFLDVLKNVELDRTAAFARLGKSMQDYQVKTPGSAEHNEAKALLEDGLKTWNKEIRDSRPVFSAMADDVAMVIEQDNWPEALRNRLGLAHLNPQGGIIHIALMRYLVQDVLDAFARMKGAAHAPFAAPTALDGPIWEYFFPAPLDPKRDRNETYGRTMPLVADLNNHQLVTELLHIKMDYKPEHFYKIGTLTTPVPDHVVRQLRNEHLFVLRYETDRETFGEQIPAMTGTA